MARKSEVKYWQSRGGYYSTIRGEVHCLRKCDACDRPAGPHYQAAVARLGELLASQPIRSSDCILASDVIACWRRERELLDRPAAPGTLCLLRRFDGALGRLRIDQITVPDVVTWALSQRSWGGATKRNALDQVKAVFRWAFTAGRIAVNPLAGLYKPPGCAAMPRGPEFLIDGELGDLLIETAGGALRDLLTGLRSTGARPVELLNAQPMHFDQAGRRIVFRAHARKGYRHKTAGSKKRGQLDRVIHLTPAVEQIVARNARRGDWLFPGARGQHYKYLTAYQAWERCKTQPAVVDYLRQQGRNSSTVILYSFRHSWITQALLRGVAIHMVADLAGTSIEQIQATYSHVTSDRAAMRAAFDQCG